MDVSHAYPRVWSGEMRRDSGHENTINVQLIHLPLHLSSPHEDQRVRLPGILRNYNTIEDFNKADKLALLNDLGVQVSSPLSLLWRVCPKLMSRLLILGVRSMSIEWDTGGERDDRNAKSVSPTYIRRSKKVSILLLVRFPCIATETRVGSARRVGFVRCGRGMFVLVPG